MPGCAIRDALSVSPKQPPDLFNYSRQLFIALLDTTYFSCNQCVQGLCKRRALAEKQGTAARNADESNEVTTSSWL